MVARPIHLGRHRCVWTDYIPMVVVRKSMISNVVPFKRPPQRDEDPVQRLAVEAYFSRNDPDGR
jgi:hypothetical protein